MLSDVVPVISPLVSLSVRQQCMRVSSPAAVTSAPQHAGNVLQKIITHIKIYIEKAGVYC